MSDLPFWILAPALVVCAVGVVTSRNLYRGAYWLAAALVITALFYLVLTAPLDGVVVGEPWPYVGLDVEQDAVLFELTPRVAAGRSLAELEALHTEKESALNLAEDRLARLEGLLPLSLSHAPP